MHRLPPNLTPVRSHHRPARRPAPPSHARLARAAALAALAAFLTLTLGCASGRPRVDRSAAEVAWDPLVADTAPTPPAADTDSPAPPADPAEQAMLDAQLQHGELDFFDELARRRVASVDDANHAALLVLTDGSATSPAARARESARWGLLQPGFSRDPREAVTTGEVCAMLMRGLERSRAWDDAAATSRMKTLQLLPASASATRGLTGEQLVSLIAATSALVDSRGGTASLWQAEQEESFESLFGEPTNPDAAALTPDANTSPDRANAKPAEHPALGSGEPLPTLTAGDTPAAPNSPETPAAQSAPERRGVEWVPGRRLRRPAANPPTSD